MTGTAASTRPLRAVVCGTTFGQVYLEAFRSPGFPLELAGIVAQGSERSRAVAARHEVPLYRDVDALPDVDVAAVVVRSGLLGGRGTELAQALMRRGVHVLQEHPVHRDELVACLATARRFGVVYRLNSFYVHVEPVRRFVATARELLRRQAPLFVDAACGYQVVYALLDILGQTLGTVRPWGFAEPGRLPADAIRGLPAGPMFTSLDGVIGGVPLTLRVQNQIDPRDPDNHLHLLHRVSVGSQSGNLTLVNTHGPVLWTPRPDFGDVKQGAAFAGSWSERCRLPSSEIVGPEAAPTYEQIFEQLWPDAVRHALLDVRDAVDQPSRSGSAGQYHLSLCELWEEVSAKLGPPELVHGTAPPMLAVADLMARAR